MRDILREPLVHFLVGGAALFLLFGHVSGPGAGRPDEVVVGEAQVEMLARGFERTWLRAPTRAELDGLVDDYVTEELLYREALALGLDRDDLVVRRRMRQKMEFLYEGLEEREPEEAELRAFLAAHPERFRLPERLGFVQVFVAPGTAGAREGPVDEWLARLRAGADPGTLGDATLLPARMEAASAEEIARSFGEDFAAALADVPPGTWSGPLPSAYGAHLVRVDVREPGRVPDLDEVRAAVAREWAAEQRERARERFQESLRSRYRIEVRMPEPEAPPRTAQRP